MAEKDQSHPYLSGNFAPVNICLPLTPCDYQGQIPAELAGGQYVRNGANPLKNEDLNRAAHWFDGDGMLTGVLFRRCGPKATDIQPEFVNQFLLTDVYCYSKQAYFLRRPLLPSIATLMDPAKPFAHFLFAVFRSVALVILSRLPDRYTIKKISVANTNVIYHDGRALATCESGPPLRFSLPSLETIGWFDGHAAENEQAQPGPTFGGSGPLAFMREWTTAHPRVDPVTGELISFHSNFAKPYVRYSIVKPLDMRESKGSRLFSEAVPGVESPKMMHDFGVSAEHTVIMDIPLSLDPKNRLRGVPSLNYDSTTNTRFGVFPRYEPSKVEWFEASPCLIFHSANCWTTRSSDEQGFKRTSVSLVVCRFTYAAAIFTPANLETPIFPSVASSGDETDQSRLYYYEFTLGGQSHPGRVRCQWALSSIPFEFPTMSQQHSMHECQYIYGCSTSGCFDVALGKVAKVDYLAKINIKTLILRGMQDKTPDRGCVDRRTIDDIMAADDPTDAIRLFRMPPGWYAQEPRFIPRKSPATEDDGWLVTYVFDESQLDDSGACIAGAASELWIIDARSMKDVVARVKLPQRVPYGLHGCWFDEDEIHRQRPFEHVRTGEFTKGSVGAFKTLRNSLERFLG